MYLKATHCLRKKNIICNESYKNDQVNESNFTKFHLQRKNIIAVPPSKPKYNSISKFREINSKVSGLALIRGVPV